MYQQPQQSYSSHNQRWANRNHEMAPQFGGQPQYVDRPEFGRLSNSTRGTVDAYSTGGPTGQGGDGFGSMLPSTQLRDAFATANNGKLYPPDQLPPSHGSSAQDPSQRISSLSGQTLSPSEFTHNNMVPFFGGSVKQNIEPHRNTSRMELHTGTPSIQRKKESVPAMFAPTKDNTYTYGAPNLPETLRDTRYNPSLYRQGEKPSYEERVGPGLNQGFTAEPSGGFHQSDVRDYALPKTVDELRIATNPKITYTEPIVRGIAPHKKPGKQATVSKNQPDRFYVNTPDRYYTTTGAVKGRRLRSQPVDKFTHRTQTSREHTGPAGNREHVRERDRAERHVRTTEPFRVETSLDTDGIRNASGGERWGDIESFTGDYGKTGIEMLPNERDTTQLNQYLSSAVRLVKEIVKPLEDVMRTSRKENVIGNPRPNGNMGSSIKKPSVHDPNDLARTTLKETNIHDNRTGPLSGTTRLAATVYDPNDIARTTVKETNIHNTRTGNVQNGPRKLATYDPNDIARTTLKETNIHDNRTGNLANVTRRAVPAYDPNDIARTTLKETNIHDNRTGNMADVTRRALPVYDPNDIARTTIKETNIHDNRLGQLSAQPSGEGQGGKQHGTVAFQDDAKTTIRETVDPEPSEMNLAPDVPRATVYDPNDIARTTIKETNIDHTRQGNVTGLDTREGYSTNPQTAPNTNRQFTADTEYAGTAGVSEGRREGGYQVNDAHAPPTQRHELSDKDYTGSAQSGHTAPTSYDDAYNARTDEMKEVIAEGRQPTLTGNKASPNTSSLCVEQRDDQDRANQRDLMTTDVKQIPLHQSACAVTKEKMNLAIEPERNQPDPALLKAFTDNPFTQPLDSA